eukprot:c24785_g6_i1 orf=450-968(-)
MAMAQCMPAAPWPIPSISPPSSSSIRRKFASLCRPIVMEIHLKRLPFDMTRAASKQSSNEQSWRCLSAVPASLSSASPEEDSASFPSKELGPKIDLNHPRRKLQVSFTCDACGVRSQRLINPNAYARGTVFVQCGGCDVYHKLVDNLNLIEEYDFRQETDSKADDSDVNVVE